MFNFKKQGNRIEAVATESVTKEFCGVQHKALTESLSELKTDAKSTQELLHEVHVMVAKMEATINGGMA